MIMRPWLWTICIASLLTFSLTAGAADEGSLSSGTGSVPPVSQALVREGDFAIKLAAALELGTPTTEAEAEDLLAKADIAPLNGWLSDYPVTPQIMGQLEDAISRSASQGKVSMSIDQAVAVLHATASQLDLPIPAERTPATATGTPPPVTESRPNQQVINNYYYDAGPPIVTYYPPPYGYVYLYDWVPYPVWWYGFWFPGFYICHDFTTVVVYQARPLVVSNHFHDPHTGTIGRVDPRGHRGGHDGRPQSELRASGGSRYLTLADVRRGVRMAGPSGEGWRRSGERTFTGTDRHREPKTGRGAGEMYSRNMRVPLPDDSAVHNPTRGGNPEVFRRYSGHAADRSPGRRYTAGEGGRYVPSRRYTPAMRDDGRAWGGRVSRSPGSFSYGHSSPNVQRSSGRPVSGMGGGYGGARSRY